MVNFFKHPVPLQRKQALCLVQLQLPLGYRPLKWNAPKLLEAIEMIGFFGFVPTNAGEGAFMYEPDPSAISPIAHE